MCTSSLQCPAGQDCISGVCSKPAVHGRPLTRLLLLAGLIICSLSGGASAADPAECQDAQRAASFAATTCSLVTGQCVESCAPARARAESQCDSVLSRERAACEQSDPSFIPACQTEALTRHGGCLQRARAINFCSTEACESQTKFCAQARVLASQAERICKN